MSGGALFSGVVFEAALSLGANCEPAHALRLNGRYSARGVFDWLVTPLTAIAYVLQDDGAQLGRRFVTSNLGTSVRCGAYGLLYHHEFERAADNAVIFSAEAVERCRAKMAHKMKTFIDACEGSGPLLFIRIGPESDLPDDELGAGKRAPDSDDLNRLVSAIDQRFPKLDFRLLVVTPTPGLEGDYSSAPLDPRIAVEQAPRADSAGWALDELTWASIFERVTFAAPASAAGQAVGETLHWFASADLDDSNEAVEAYQDGLRLQAGGKSYDAMTSFQRAFRTGLREERFLHDHLGLLCGETRYAEMLEILEDLRAEGLDARGFAMASGLAKLALAYDSQREIELAERREASERWLDVGGVLAVLLDAITARRPASFIRAGDGEARFLIASGEPPNIPIESDERYAIADNIWTNWFGESWSSVDPEARAELVEAYRRAVMGADIIGATDARRLREDTGHFGYLAWQERWLAQNCGQGAVQYWTSALVPRDLHQASPYLASLLAGLDFLGVISPHPDLASALAEQFGIENVASYVIPAEGRLPTAGATRHTGRHFPDVYCRLLSEINVPRIGAVFLVAGGLLGKIYCGRIKELGGIALDIGALADAWMGYDTREGQFAHIQPLRPATPSAEFNMVRHDNEIENHRCDLEEARASLKALQDRIADGFAVDFNDYAYKPYYRDSRKTPGMAALSAKMQADAESHSRLLESFLSFNTLFRTIPVLPMDTGPHWENWWLPGLDAVVLYGLVATRRPSRYLEVGSGHSTRFVRQAIIDHGLSTEIISIDPHPTAEIDRLCDRVIRTNCEDAPMSVFQDLKAGDMLFIDSSHRSFQGSDVTVFFSEILPSLDTGVLYGLHDIFLPYDYPESWTNRFYNEQYLMLAYLLGGAGGDQIIFPTHYVSQEAKFAPLLNRLFLGAKHIDWLASTFWMERGRSRSAP